MPTSGTATIYGSPVAEIAEASEMKRLVGICPQFNIIFDVLTVEEHLKIFAAIKGIPAADVDTEVRRTSICMLCKKKKILDLGILGIFSNDSEGWRIKVPSSGC